METLPVNVSFLAQVGTLGACNQITHPLWTLPLVVQMDGPMAGKAGRLTTAVDRYGDSAPIAAGYNPV